MPLIIKRAYKPRIKKRHLSLLVFILILTIAIYRACYITYHYRIIKLSTFTIDRIELKQASGASSDFQIELSANFSKSYCPLNLEFIEITASAFTEDPDPCVRHHSGSLISLSVDKLRLDKKTPLKFSANLRVSKFHLESSLLDMLVSDFTVQFSFYVRARFCYVPLYFFKNIVKRRSELAKRGEHSVSSDPLTFRIVNYPLSSIQIGLRRRFFTQVLGESPSFVFNVGCLKFDFSGCIHKSVLVSSFDTRYYCKGSDDEDAPRTSADVPADRMKLYVPGIGVDDDVVFFFISIPLYDGESLGKMVVDQLRNRTTHLKIDKVSALVFEDAGKRSMVGALRDIPVHMISKGVANPNGAGSESNGHYFTEICVFRDVYVLNPQKSTPGRSSVFVNGFELSKKQMSCSIGLSSNHSAYSIIRYVLANKDLKCLYDNLSIESQCVIGGKPVTRLNVRLTNVPADEEFFNVAKVVMTFENDVSFEANDLRSIVFQSPSFSLSGRSIIILNVFEVVVDCQEGIFLKQGERVIPIYIFPPSVSRVFRLDHELSDSSDGKFLNIRTRLDMTTYGSREKAADGPSLEDAGNGIEGSFLKIELPNISVSATNSFMKLRSKVLGSCIFFTPRYDGCRLSHVEKKGVVVVQSAAMFKRLPASSQSIDSLMTQEEVCIKISQLATFRIYPAGLLSKKQSKVRFMKFLPFLIELDVMDGRFTSLMSTAASLRHVLDGDDHLSDYLKCVSKDFPRSHGWNPDLCNILETHEPTRHFIVNVFHAKKASYAIEYTRYTPLVLDGTDIDLALVYTGDNMFMYFCRPFNVNARLADPSIYDDPEAFTSKFLRDSHLHRLVDFLFNGIIRKVSENKCNAPQDPFLVPETIGLSIKANRTNGNCYALGLRIVIPKNIFSWPEFIHLSVLGRYTLHSMSGNAFSLSLTLDSDGSNFVLELGSSWNDSFWHGPIELVPHMLGKELNHFKLDMLGLLAGIRKYIVFIVENLNTPKKSVVFNYMSPESISAFFDSGYDSDFIFKEETVWTSEPSSPRISAPWRWDIEFANVSKKPFGFGLELKLWSDELFSYVGSVFSHVFDLLPCKIKPGFVGITLDVKNLLDFRVENSSRRKIFGLERLDIAQPVPIRVPICSRPSHPEPEDESLFYARLRDEAKASIDQCICVNADFYIRGYSTLVNDVLSDDVKLSHSLESCGLKLPGHGGKDKSFVKLRLTDFRNCLIDMKLPFLINIVGEPIYLVLKSNTPLAFISKLKGPMFDPKAVSKGYNASLPVSSRRLKYLCKQVGAKTATDQVPIHFRKQCDLVTKHGDSVLHCRGAIFSGTMSRNVMFMVVERVLSTLVPREAEGFLSGLESWIMSSISKNLIRSTYVECDPSIDGSFAENGFELNSEDINLLQDLLCKLDFS